MSAFLVAISPLKLAVLSANSCSSLATLPTLVASDSQGLSLITPLASVNCFSFSDRSASIALIPDDS